MALKIFIPKDDPKYRITSDSHCFIVERAKTVVPTKSPNWKRREAQGADPTPYQTWSDPKYYSTLVQAVESLINREALESEAETLPELLYELQEIKREIRTIIT